MKVSPSVWVEGEETRGTQQSAKGSEDKWNTGPGSCYVLVPLPWGKAGPRVPGLLWLTAPMGGTQLFRFWGNFPILFLFPCLLDIEQQSVFPQASHGNTVSSAIAFPPSLFFPDNTRRGESGSPPMNAFPAGPRGSKLTLSPETSTPTGPCLVHRQKKHAGATLG